MLLKSGQGFLGLESLSSSALSRKTLQKTPEAPRASKIGSPEALISWFRVQGLGFKVYGFGFRVQSLGFRV